MCVVWRVISDVMFCCCQYVSNWQVQQYADDGRYICLSVEEVYTPHETIIQDEEQKWMSVTPRSCKDHRISFTTPLFARLNITSTSRSFEEEVVTHPTVLIGHIPVMLGSSLYATKGDERGSFLIKGTPRFIISQERMASNVVMVDEEKCWIRSEVPGQDISYTTVLKNVKGLVVEWSYPRSFTVPLMLLLKALGVSLPSTLYQEGLEETLQADVPHMTQMEAWDWIGKRVTSPGSKQAERIEKGKQALQQYFLPHTQHKGPFVLYMIQRFLDVQSGAQDPDDRDDYRYKRLDTPGVLLTQVFHQAFRQMHQEVCRYLQRVLLHESEVRSYLLISPSISQALERALATGNWPNGKTGISQMPDTEASMASLGHRSWTPISTQSRAINPRLLHFSQYGYICPVETPEGNKCGLTKQLSLGCRITSVSDATLFQDRLRELQVSFALDMSRHLTKIFLNGAWVATYTKPQEILPALRFCKTSLERDASISWDQKRQEIHIYCDKGRFVRPLKVNGMATLDTDQLSVLEQSGLIEWLDPSEQAHISTHDKYGTHQEIDPCILLGRNAALIPNITHNPAQRATFQASMCKQAYGPGEDMLLHYPQRPLSQTLTTPRDYCAGINAVVSIMTAGGENVEDALLMNQGSVDRGLFGNTKQQIYHCTTKHNLSAVVKKNQELTRGQKLCVVVPHPDVQDALPVIPKAKTEGVVSKVVVVKRHDLTILHVYVRRKHHPHKGDKFATRHGQKGTIGRVVPPEDLPFTQEGIIPDIIINPHAFPGRATVGQLLEMVQGKIGALSGSFVDATAFRNISMSELEQVLVTQCHGSSMETMRCGMTGQEFECKIFVGIVFYQALKHLADLKLHAAAEADQSPYTRQPVQGKTQKGGLRFGEMERDCTIAHNAVCFLSERLFSGSAFSMTICRRCGYRSQPQDQCPCQLRTEPVSVALPYACKLLFQELMAMGIGTRLIL